MSHVQNDARCVGSGEDDTSVPSRQNGWGLRQMCASKNGHPFIYSECLVLTIVGIHLQLGITLMYVEEMTTAALDTENTLDHVTLWGRMKNLDASFTDRTITVKDKDSTLLIIVDSTDMSPSAKGDYIRYKHKIKTSQTS